MQSRENRCEHGRTVTRHPPDVILAQVPPWCGVLEPLDDRSCVLRTGAESLEALVCQMMLTRTDFEILEPREIVPQVRETAERIYRAMSVRRKARRGRAGVASTSPPRASTRLASR